MQNSWPLSTYYNELIAIFQEIDHRIASQKRLVEGIVKWHFGVARLRVHIFLRGLNFEFDQVRGKILRKDPKFDLESFYVYIRREAQQRQIMESSRPVPENSTMVVERDTERVKVFHHQEKQITRIEIILVKKSTPNSTTLRLLGI